MKFNKSLLIGSILVASITCNGFILANSNVFNAKQAQSIAEQQVPQGSTYIKTKYDKNKYEIKFYNETKKEMYEIDIKKSTQKITKYKTQLRDNNGSNTVKLSEEDAKKVVINEIPKAEILSVKLDTDDGLKEYKIKFKTDSYFGEMDINPSTGIILEREFRFYLTDINNVQNSDFITVDKVKEIASNKVPNGIITDLDLEKTANGYIYEVEIYKDNYEYDLILDASNGSEISMTKYLDDWDWDYDEFEYEDNKNNTNNNQISAEQAKQIALEKVPGATITKLELDYDDGKAKYEGKMYKGGIEYEFEIDAYTGKIIEWDIDD